jgi:hypothetical protein
MDNPDQNTTQVLAIGVAGYAVAMELLSKLEERGLISRDDGAGIIDSALAALERADAQTPHPAFRMARRALDAQMKVWQRDRPE